MIKINAQPVKITILQVYLPTSEYYDSEVDENHDQEEVFIKICNKGSDYVIVMSDFNKLFITNTWFIHDKRQRYTWEKPGDTNRFQKDYTLVTYIVCLLYYFFCFFKLMYAIQVRMYVYYVLDIIYYILYCYV